MSISQGGLKNFGRSYNSKWLKQNLLTDTNGNYILNYTDPATGKMKSVTNKKELRQWAAEQGIIDKFIADEIGVNLALKTGLKALRTVSEVKNMQKRFKSKFENKVKNAVGNVLSHDMAKKLSGAAVMLITKEVKVNYKDFRLTLDKDELILTYGKGF